MKTNKIIQAILITGLILIPAGLHSQKLSLIPQPAEMIIRDGMFSVTSETGLKFESSDKDLHRTSVTLKNGWEQNLTV